MLNLLLCVVLRLLPWRALVLLLLLLLFMLGMCEQACKHGVTQTHRSVALLRRLVLLLLPPLLFPSRLHHSLLLLLLPCFMLR